jgi:hypothetical protein
MDNLVYLIPVVVGMVVGIVLANKANSSGSGFTRDSSDSLDDLNTRDRLKYGFILADNMEKDRRERAERVRRREEKDY